MCTILKKILVVFLVFLNTLLVTVAVGQCDYFCNQDTIRLQMPNGTTVEYAMRYERDLVKYDRQKLVEQKQLKTEIEHFLKRWDVLGITNLKEKKPLFIEDLATKIKISERSENTTVLFPKDAKVVLLVKGKHKLKLQKKGSNVFVYFDEIKQLRELKEYDFEKIFKNSDKQLDTAAADQKNKRKPLQAWLSVDKNDEVGLTYQKFDRKKKKNYISLTMNPNIENINGSWLAGMDLSLSYVLNSNFLFGVGWDTMYNFSETGETNISQWIDGRIKVAIDKSGGRWFGLSFGFLVDHRGNFFENNKFRLGIPCNINNAITITPQVYSRGIFKKEVEGNEYFGIKISYNIFGSRFVK